MKKVPRKSSVETVLLAIKFKITELDMQVNDTTPVNKRAKNILPYTESMYFLSPSPAAINKGSKPTLSFMIDTHTKITLIIVSRIFKLGYKKLIIDI
ncbi:MAG: hypothetical protein LBI95_02760 [Holosporales bacterium]|nr:hypothetical protein [Holosporales bacterium]